MTIDEIKRQMKNLETKLNIVFPKSYNDFLSKLNDGETFEVNNSGVSLYSYSDLEERNETYQIKDYEPNYFMIGQDGDLGFFINLIDSNDDAI